MIATRVLASSLTMPLVAVGAITTTMYVELTAFTALLLCGSVVALDWVCFKARGGW